MNEYHLSEKQQLILKESLQDLKHKNKLHQFDLVSMAHSMTGLW
jgi:hypothetical protein